MTMTFAAGDRVNHTSYGDGTIVSTNEYHTVIDFDEHGKRTFSSSRVTLSASNTPAPEPKRPAAKRTRKKPA
jgi:hypothetical protein